MKSLGTEAFQLSFQISPIVLTNGIAQLVPGGMLPIIAITEALNFAEGLLGGGDQDIGLDQSFAHFKVMPGSTLIENAYGKYPYANQSVAANAVIVQPLGISLMMTLQIKNLAARLATMTALQAALGLHTNLGGTYTVVTPSFPYTNLVLRSLKGAGDQGTQSQVYWQWDFEQPLLTEQQAAITMNGFMSNIAGGLPTTGALSGPQVVSNPLSLAAGSIFPSSSSLTGTGVAGSVPM